MSASPTPARTGWRMPDGRKLALIGLLLVLVAAAAVSVLFWQKDTTTQDIYWDWVDGSRLLAGENPYARVLAGDMRLNDKYTTYFPVFIILSSLTQRAGLRDYPQWIAFWRVVFLIFNLGITSAIFLLLYRRRQYVMAVFGALFWILSRWTLGVLQISHLDFIPLFFLIVSLGLFEKHRWASLALLGVSLSVKQIAIFLAPLYLVWVWEDANKDALRQTALAALVIASVPLVTSLPFIAWNAEGFAKSILFSATRLAGVHLDSPSLDAFLGWEGLPARLPMLGLMALVYWAAWRRKVGMFVSALLVMATFQDLNTVLFRQYMVWLVPFVPLVVCDFADAQRAKEPPAAS
jgi:uncharacterized membrane protein